MRRNIFLRTPSGREGEKKIRLKTYKFHHARKRMPYNGRFATRVFQI